MVNKYECMKIKNKMRLQPKVHLLKNIFKQINAIKITLKRSNLSGLKIKPKPRNGSVLWGR